MFEKPLEQNFLEDPQEEQTGSTQEWSEVATDPVTEDVEASSVEAPNHETREESLIPADIPPALFERSADSLEEAFAQNLLAYDEQYVTETLPEEERIRRVYNGYFEHQGDENWWKKLYKEKTGKRILFFDKRVKTIDKLLQEERDRLFQGREDEEEIKPVIVDTFETRRHHAGGGYYRYSYDAYGNTYFESPDHMGMGVEEAFSDVVGKHFNIPTFQKVRSVQEHGGVIEIRRMRFLAEKSLTVKGEEVTAEACQKIDPLPLADPDISFLGAALLNVATGVSDIMVYSKETAADQKINYVRRKDDVYYLFDVRPSFTPYYPQAPDQTEKDVENSPYHFIAQVAEIMTRLDTLDTASRAHALRYLADATTTLGITASELSIREKKRSRKVDLDDATKVAYLKNSFTEVYERITKHLRRGLSEQDWKVYEEQLRANFTKMIEVNQNQGA